jgi:hypothetical protein
VHVEIERNHRLVIAETKFEVGIEGDLRSDLSNDRLAAEDDLVGIGAEADAGSDSAERRRRSCRRHEHRTQGAQKKQSLNHTFGPPRSEQSLRGAFAHAA